MKRIKISVQDTLEARKQIGDAMRAARESRGYTASTLARKMTIATGKSVSSHVVNALECVNGKSYQIDSLLLAMIELGVEIEIVIPEVDTPNT